MSPKPYKFRLEEIGGQYQSMVVCCQFWNGGNFFPKLYLGIIYIQQTLAIFHGRLDRLC